MGFPRPLACALLHVTLAIAACGGRSPDNADPRPEAEAPFEGTPRVRVFVNERPHDPTEVEHEIAADERVRYGDPLHVVVDGIEPGRVRIESHSFSGASSATFTATNDTTVDLARDVPVAGSWDVADMDAFIWSMVDPVAGPLDLTITVRVLSDDDDELASTTIARRFINDGVTTEPVDAGTRQGLLAIPSAERFGAGPFPGVLVFGGSEGGTGTGTFLAQYLASLGYAALGVGYFGAAGLPEKLAEVPLELLEGDLALLASDPRVDAERLAVMGGSRGGELALLLGVHFPVVKAVIATVPSGYVWPAVNGGGLSAWTLDGEPLATVPPVPNSLPEWYADENGTHYVERETFLEAIAAADPAALEAATIPTELIGGSVLMYGGADDQLWASCDLMEVSWQRREAAGHGPHDQKICFPDAGHGIFVPGDSTVDSFEFYFPDGDFWLVMGGTPAGTGRAARLADTALRGFLESAL